MKQKNKIFFLLFFLIVTKMLFAQYDSLSTDYYQQILEDMTSDDDDSQLYDLFEYYINNPVDLNSASLEDLRTLPNMGNYFAEQIVEYRDSVGRIFYPQELFTIRNIDQGYLRTIIPFLVAHEPVTQKDILPGLLNNNYFLRSCWKSNLPINTDEKEKYSGTPYRIYNRFLLNNSYSFKAGFIFEKDAGETQFNDLSSYHLQIKLSRVFEKIIFGDYNIEFGQGLVLWSPYALSKGSDAILPFAKKERELVTKTSSEENIFFRGIAGKVNFGGFTFQGFYSKNLKDAVLKEDGTISSIPLTGYHRTQSELTNKKSIQETAFGVIMNLKFDNYSLSLLAYQSKLSSALAQKTQFGLNGNTFMYFSSSYNFSFNSFQIKGEWAFNKTSVASINSLLFRISEKVKIIFSVRNYPRNFSNLYGNAIGEKRGTMNETGMYVGTIINTQFGKINFYLDQFSFPYLGSDSPFSSNGKELLFNFESKWYNKFSSRIKFKSESKEKTLSDTPEKTFTSNKYNLRLELKYNPSSEVKLKSGFEFTKGNFVNGSIFEKGYLFYQDMMWRISQLLNISARIVMFDTESYNSRIYNFENDVPGSLTNLPCYGKGMKWYLILKLTPLEGLMLSMKYSSSYNEDIYESNNIGQKLHGVTEENLSIQIDYKL